MQISATTIPVLVVAYRRFDNLRAQVSQLISLGNSRIYIALDGPKSTDDRTKSDCDKAYQIAKEFLELYPERVHIRKFFENFGAAVNVISACEWFFSNEEFGIILEDDCLFSDSFFHFVGKMYDKFDSSSEIVMICGSQFAPLNVSKNHNVISKYPLIWGWATSVAKWKCLMPGFLENDADYRSKSKLSLREKVYWNSGARRAFEGHIDAWDIIVARNMLRDEFRAILPSRSLISNIGNDEFSTHTREKSPWLNMKISLSSDHSNNLIDGAEVDSWLMKNFYNIRCRHLISTQITRAWDMLFRRKNLLPVRLRRAAESHLDSI